MAANPNYFGRGGESVRPTRKAKAKDRPKADESCYFCGWGILEKKRVTVDFRWGKKLVIIFLDKEGGFGVGSRCQDTSQKEPKSHDHGKGETHRRWR